MARYTFFVQKQGGTYIDQVSAGTVQEAVEAWFRASETRPGPFEPEEDTTPIEGREGVWCFTGIDPEEVFFMVHVVES